ncbi:beta-ketoacyl-[acyl-carrier-protein] synthase family protein [Chryseolinea lacunae]|uniref:Beta-ketoacyl-[acyl-carrier-protein] synthase family protein n=1 Tax=Chryseolinea lacunae TaxID=2801331 RepID=A0ABS1KNN9_9BACT|nr:beta-ketoacyl-[acyl-carrier-protein] synthase family protein [Chryseolinea lacunae]MBL0740848.1 beta-ketoacyl-[acyl-carrier-protein] synthase family protein [Chryseolinea lacunae]
MSQRVFITGFGIITSIGKNTAENVQSLLHRRCGFGELNVLDTIHGKTLPACEIKLFNAELCALAGVAEGKGYTRTALLGLIALQEAIQSASLSPAEVQQAGLLSSTTTGGIREFERHFYELMDPTQAGDFVQYTDTANPGEHGERLADAVGIKKYIATLSTACSSSANSIMQGAQLIKHGKLERAICGGTEALSRFTINGFNSLMIVDPQHCRPFDNTRKGLNLGEGAAFVVLEGEDALAKSKKQPLAELKGYGNANDAFHQTASSPEGTGAFNAMRLALDMGGIAPADVDYINAHGTATENNDLSEGFGIQKLFGDTVPLFSSTKPYTGHTLAAAGSIEAVYCLLGLQHRVVWPNLNFNEQMPELSVSPVRELKQNVTLKQMLSNSFGFGGNTSSLLIAAV